VKTIVTTLSSRWVFDDVSKTYTRQPLAEDADHPNVAYDDVKPIAYTVFGPLQPGFGMCVVHPDGSRLVTRPVTVEVSA